MPNLANRDQHEAAIVSALEPIFQAQYLRALRSPTNIPYAEFQAALERAMAAQLGQVFREAGAFLLVGNALMVSQGAFERRAAGWSTGFAHQLAAEVVANSQAAATAAIAKAAVGGMTQQRLAEALALVFMSDARIENIAITEVTRAVSAGEETAVFFFPIEEESQRLVGVWHVEERGGRPDGRVCPICLPFNRHGPLVYGRKFPNGPPAHPRCRCWREWVTAEQFARGITTGRRAA